MELYSRKINIWLLQRFVLIVLLHCKKAEEKWHGTLPFNSDSAEFVAGVLGKKRMLELYLMISSFHHSVHLLLPLPGKALHYFSTAFPSLQVADMRGCQEGLCSSRLSLSGKAPVPTRAGLPSQYLVFLFHSPLGPFVGSSNGHSWKWFLFLPLYHYFASKFWLLG